MWHKSRYVFSILFVFVLSLSVTVAQDSTSDFYDPEEYNRQIELLDTEPQGPDLQPWLQTIAPNYIDTSGFVTEGPWTICFSNAGLFNPWRVVGFTTMESEVELHPGIEDFIVVDAEGSDEKQIADIADLVSGGDCDLLIVSPNTTAALTPAVEQACQELPVIVFDRGVQTDCPVTFISPIGGYAFGAAGARFVVENIPEGGSVLALRISPGVDVLETRWAAAEQIFNEADVEVIGVEFTGDDRATARSIVEDYLERFGTIDAVWMDAGATSVAVIEAFEDFGVPVPIITGEDQQDFLVAWNQSDLTAIGPTYPTFQWRTAVIAATHILSGQAVPEQWVLPQPTVTDDNLDNFIQANMPPQHYALCGCENMPGYPDAWGGTPLDE
jgi:ribose transport system substrate-binding protein